MLSKTSLAQPLAICLFLICIATESYAESQSTRLASIDNFAFAIGSDVLNDSFERLKSYDLVVIDGEEATASQILELQSSGALVLGYLSVGTIERYRSWYKRAKPFRLDYWRDFGEWYADTSNPDFRKLLAKKVVPKLVRKGFDGLFLDNIDMIREHPKQRKGMVKLVEMIAAYVHHRDKFLFAQNGEDVFGRIFNSLDGWNREDVTSTYDFERSSYETLSADEIEQNLAALSLVRAKGLLVTATDYIDSENTVDRELAVSNACSVGALSFVSNIELTEIAETPLTCD